ncbi:MAG: hypothetical protein NTY77_05870 [Elusimicrobia bacterium]|nr:hypothetical protein [Elusimicrobiota bacterium]
MRLGPFIFALALSWAAQDQDPDAVLSGFAAPLQNLAGTTAYADSDVKCASEWALWDMLSDLAKKRADGVAKPEPDLGLVETGLRLTMRLNTGELKRFGSKPYPADEDFRWAAAEAGKAVQAHAAGLKPEDDLLASPHARAVERIMVKALKRMIAFRLRPQTRGTFAVPPFSQGPESFYVNKAVMNKSGETYSFPPWPDRR